MKTMMILGAALLTPVTLANAQQAAPATTPAPTAAAAPTVGATVNDTAGTPVGTISAVSATAITIDTGAHKVPVPVTSVGPGTGGLVIGMTKTQLDSAYEAATAKASADMKAKLVPGTAVSTLNGGMTVGTIKMADAANVTVTTPKGDVKLPISGFSTNATGGVIIGMTAEQFTAAMAAAAPAAAAATPAQK